MITKKIPDPIVLTPETPSVVPWKERLADRPDEYLMRIRGNPNANVEASHHYACELLLRERHGWPTPAEILYRDVPLSRNYGSAELNEKIRALRDQLPRDVGEHLYDRLIEEYGETEVAITRDIMVNGPETGQEMPDLDPDLVERIEAVQLLRLVYREGRAAAEIFRA